jgi:two-component system response regulator AtoC
MALCLIVEDDDLQSDVIASTLQVERFETLSAASGAAALNACHEFRPQVILLDLGLPDIDGLALIPQLLKASPLSRIIVLTGRDSARAAVDALRAGARHYLVKPWEQDELLLVVERESSAVDSMEHQQREGAAGVYWASHPAIGRLRQDLTKLAEAPWTPVLIQGPTGSGKEVIARELHRLTAPGGLFVPVNCAAIPGDLLESELFGHERGAFTGADVRRRGLVELAREGTLFLDEIAEMSRHLQAKLLRYLEGQRFRRLGGEDELHTRCRIVAATHRDLEELVRTGRFREDLFFRLAVVRQALPALKECQTDIVPLARFLLAGLARSMGRATKRLSPAAEAGLAEHDWPGNIRELRNRLERAVVLSEGDELQLSDLELPRGTFHGLSSEGADGEAARLRQALEDAKWNVARAARSLGVPRHWIRYHMSKHGLARPHDG